MKFMKQQQDRLEELYALYPDKVAELEAAQVEANKERQRIREGSQEVPLKMIAFHNIVDEARSMKEEIEQLEKSVSYEYEVWEHHNDGTFTHLGTLVAPRKLEAWQKFLVGDELYEPIEAIQDKGLLYVVAHGTVKKGRWEVKN